MITFKPNHSYCCKAVNIDGHRLVVIGYAFDRKNPDLPLGNAETGGLLDDFIFFSVSEDGDILMSHWYAEQGQYKTMATRIKL